MAAAEDVTATYDGPVTDGDKHWRCPSDAGDGLEEPTWCYCCTVTHPHLDASHLVDCLLDDCYDGAEVDGSDIDALQSLLDAWCAGLSLEMWGQDSTRKVLVTP